MRRVHRTVVERIGYMALYQCRQCQDEHAVPRRWKYHLGPGARCPLCGTHRVTKLKVPDKIDPKHGGFLNFLEHLANGKLYHCCFCRIQFYDRRRMMSPADPSSEPVAGESAEAARQSA